jgi:hypothetical protein
MSAIPVAMSKANLLADPKSTSLTVASRTSTQRKATHTSIIHVHTQRKSERDMTTCVSIAKRTSSEYRQ